MLEISPFLSKISSVTPGAKMLKIKKMNSKLSFTLEERKKSESSLIR
jgi:hypothetical protein